MMAVDLWEGTRRVDGYDVAIRRYINTDTHGPWLLACEAFSPWPATPLSLMDSYAWSIGSEIRGWG